jgi:hypothetical protein
MTKTRMVKPTDLERGMMLKAAFYNEFTEIAGVSIGLSSVRVDLIDGSTQYHRHSGSASRATIEVAS